MIEPFLGRPTAADVQYRWAERGDSVDAGPIMTQGKGFYWAYLDDETKWPHDYECAVECFKAAAERGSIEAKHYLSICYQSGQGIKVDVEKAFRLCLEAAESELLVEDKEKTARLERARACRRLGMLYWRGIGTSADSEKGRHWYEQARLAGDLRINKMIDSDMAVRLYEDEEYGDAVELLKRTVEWPNLKGTAVAMWYLGSMLQDGVGIEKCDRDGFDCFSKGVHDVIFPYDLWEIHPRCIALCQYGIGCCFSEGRGTTCSKEEAVAWYRKAAENGVGEAYQNLGVCFVLGEGVQQSRSEARRCFQLAIENGCEEAHNDLARLDRDEAKPAG